MTLQTQVSIDPVDLAGSNATSGTPSGPLYTTLPVRSIRLLTIQRSIDPAAAILCTLSVVAFKPTVFYEALSYAWGNPKITNSIILNNHTVGVNNSLWTALSALRPTEFDRILWVDALCINQADIPEREQQVFMMGDIYRFANRVRIWLGPARDEDRGVMKHLARMAVKESPALGEFEFMKVESDEHEAIIGRFEHFFARDWWSRLWVIQEVALSGEATFHCGSDAITFGGLRQAYMQAMAFQTRYLNHNQNSNDVSALAGKMMFKFGRISLLEELRLICKRDAADTTVADESPDSEIADNTDRLQFGLSWARLLYNAGRSSTKFLLNMGVQFWRFVSGLCGLNTDPFEDPDISTANLRAIKWIAVANSLRSRQCTVPHDRVYAVQGLLPRSISADARLMPSYNETPEDAYTKTAQVVIEASQSLALFSWLDKGDKGTSNLPSWVPHWNAGMKNRQGLGFRLANESLFSAGGSGPFRLEQTFNREIVIKGILMDRINSCASNDINFSSIESLNECYEQWRRLWRHSIPYQKRVGEGRTEDVLELFFKRTMLLDCTPITSGERRSTKRLTRRQEFDEMWRAHEEGLSAKGDEYDEETFDQMGDRLRRIYMTGILIDRKFIITESGRIGIAEHTAEVGDVVFAVAGNSHMVLLRHSERYAQTWQAVSECYVHGWMDDPLAKTLNSETGLAELERNQCKEFNDIERMYSHLPKHPLIDQVPQGSEKGWHHLLVE